MKILIVQERGRHKQNQDYREALNMHRALLSIGQQSVVWGLNYDNYQIPYQEIESDCDAILVLENYDNGWLPVSQIGNSKKLKAFWSIDSHCALNQHLMTASAIRPQILLNATERYCQYFGNIPHKYWFPNCYPDDLIDPNRFNVQPAHNVGFCGNINNREPWLQLIERHFSLKRDVFVIGDDMVKAIMSYRIHFNRNISDDLNYRTFETTGLGRLCFTNRTANLEKLFEIGAELVVYDDEVDLIRKINYYLANPHEAETIAKAGQFRAKHNHTFVNRAKQLVEVIERHS